MRTLHRLGPLLLALLASAPARAQEPPGGLEERPLVPRGRFEPGERWLTCGGLRVRAAGVDRAPFEASIAWTHSVQVLERPGGFALRATLTSVVWEERCDGIVTLRSWCDDAPGPFTDAGARTWTYGFDPGWDLVEVRGPARSIRWLVDRVRPHPAEPLTAELRRRLSERGAKAIEGFLLSASERLGRPVRAVMKSLARGPILPGATWTLDPAEGPRGQVRYLGHDWFAGHFLATWQVEPGESLETRFVVDPMGRLQWLNAQHVEVDGPGGERVRTVQELAFGIVRIGAEPPVWTPPLFTRAEAR